MGLFGSLFGSMGGGGSGSVTLPVSDYETEQEFIELARELIDEFIPTPNVVWCALSESVVVDSAKPFEITKPTKTEYAVKIVFSKDDKEDRQFLKYRKDTELREGQVNGLMYDPGFALSLKDYIVWNNQRLVIKAIDKIAPFKSTILYILEFGT